MHGFTEVSGVVTHPAHTRQGYAQQLVAHTASHIFNQHKLPYLHVAKTNARAVALYQKLGFSITRKMSFWRLVKTTT